MADGGEQRPPRAATFSSSTQWASCSSWKSRAVWISMLGNQALACDWPVTSEWLWISDGRTTSIKERANSCFGVFFALYLASQVHRAAVKSVFGEYFSTTSYEFERSGGALGDASRTGEGH